MKLAVVVLALVALTGLGFLAYSRGLIRFNYPSVVDYPVRGIDVSHHQGTIDWPAVRAAGVSFAFIKASEGGDYVDPRFRRNWTAAEAAGVMRGAYHFFTFCTPGAAQAEHFVETLGGTLGELPPVADVEFAHNCSNPPADAQVRVQLQQFLASVERAFGRKPILYFTRETQLRLLADFDAYPAFLRSIFFAPAISSWNFWQYADNGRVPGVRGRVDLDVFHGAMLPP